MASGWSLDDHEALEEVVASVDRETARAELHRVLREQYETGVALIDDPDLVDQ